MAETAIETEHGGATAPASQGLAAAAAERTVRAVHRAADHLRGAAGPARQRTGAPFHHRPAQPVRDRVGAAHPDRADRRLDLRQVAAAERHRLGQPRRLPRPRPTSRSTGRPAAWLDNKLYLDSLTAQRVTLIRLPKLKPSTKKGPILPGFDIHVGEFRIDRLDIGPQVSGRARSGSVKGKADVRSGRALVELAALVNNGGDRIAFHLDAEPDRNKFDVFARVISPADGLVPAMVGTRRAINLTIGGKGSWTRWRGTAALDLSGRPAARLALGVDSGRYRLQGQWAPAQFLTGKLERLTERVVTIRGDATLKDRQLDGQLTASTAELRAVAKGTVDLAHNSYRGMRLGIDLLKPAALFPNMTGRNVRMVWTLDGPFATAAYSYRLTSDFVQFDSNGFAGLHAEGAGRLTPWPMRVPIRLAAKAITGIGDVAGAMLANPQIEGWLSITPKLVQGQDLRLTSAKWNGKLSLLIDLVTGRFDVRYPARCSATSSPASASST